MQVELIGYYGSDESHALSAWTSTSRELTKEKSARIPALLQFLIKEGHWTPFEKSAFHFLVRTDVATHIHLLKHRIGVSINAESARYKEIREDELYIPEDWPTEWKEKLEKYGQEGFELYHQAMKELTPLLGRQRAKETSRYFRGYNTKITCDIMFNFRSFVHFYRLRASEHAQKEINEIAQQMLTCIQSIPDKPFEYSLEACGISTSST